MQKKNNSLPHTRSLVDSLNQLESEFKSEFVSENSAVDTEFVDNHEDVHNSVSKVMEQEIEVDVDTIFFLSDDVPTNDNVDIDNSTMIANVDASCTLASSGNTWNGFKMIGDNIDKNLHPLFQRIDSTTRSLQYGYLIE